MLIESIVKPHPPAPVDTRHRRMAAAQNALEKRPQFHINNRTLLIGRIGHDAEAKTDKNQQEYVVLSIATKDSWKNDQGDYESRTEWHRVYAWRNLSRFAKTLQKGQLISVDGQIRYREYAEEINGTTVKHRVAEIHASKIQRLTKGGAPAPSDDQASDE